MTERPEITEEHIEIVARVARSLKHKYLWMDFDELFDAGLWQLALAWQRWQPGQLEFEQYAEWRVWTAAKTLVRRTAASPRMKYWCHEEDESPDFANEELEPESDGSTVIDQVIAKLDSARLMACLAQESAKTQDCVLRTSSNEDLAELYGLSRPDAIPAIRRRFIERYLKWEREGGPYVPASRFTHLARVTH